MKKICLLLLLVLISLFIAASATAERMGNVNVIIIMDCSGSMADNDGGALMSKAVMSFIDMCDVGGSCVGAVAFSSLDGERASTSEVEDVGLNDRNNDGVVVIPMTVVDSVGARENLRNTILSIGTGNGGRPYDGGTDIGAAFEAAYELYENSCRENGNETIVVFFSDGKVNFNERVNYTRAQSVTNAQTVSNAFKRAGVHIYVVGLKGRGADNDDFDRELLEYIASEKDDNGNEKDLLIVEDEEGASRLNSMFREVLARYLGTSPFDVGHALNNSGNNNTLIIDVRYGSIVEVNINLTAARDVSESIIRNIVIMNPHGERVYPLTINDDITASSALIGISGRYVNIKLFMPSNGNWTITLPDELDVTEAFVLNNIDVALKLEQEGGARDLRHSVDQIHLLATFVRETDGAAISDEAMYRDPGVLEMLISSWSDGVNGSAVPVQWERGQDQDGRLCFRAVIDDLREGTYEFQAGMTMQGGDNGSDQAPETVTRESNVVQINAVNTPPVLIGGVNSTFTIDEITICDPVYVLGMQVPDLFVNMMTKDQLSDIVYSFNVEEYFIDPEGSPVMWSGVPSNNQGIQLSRTDAVTMEMRVVGVGEGRVTLRASDGSLESVGNNKVTISYKVTSITETVTTIAYTIVGIVAGALLLLLAVLFSTRARFKESAKLTIVSCDLRMEGFVGAEMWLKRYRTKKVSLYDVMDHNGCMLTDFIDDKGILGKVFFLPRRGIGIRVKVTSPVRDVEIEKCDTGNLTPVKSSGKLNNGDKLILAPVEGNYLTLEYAVDIKNKKKRHDSQEEPVDEFGDL